MELIDRIAFVYFYAEFIFIVCCPFLLARQITIYFGLNKIFILFHIWCLICLFYHIKFYLNGTVNIFSLGYDYALQRLIN